VIKTLLFGFRDSLREIPMFSIFDIGGNMFEMVRNLCVGLSNKLETWTERRHQRKLELIEAKTASRFAKQEMKEKTAWRKQFGKAVAVARETKALESKTIALKVGLGLVGLFTILTLVGIAIDNAWLWTLCPWLAFLSWRVQANFKRQPADRRPFLKVLMLRMSALWIGSWLIFLIANLTRR